jgi:2,3-bisphosphoglycerate-independent phosphoglycerate mutase
MMTASTPKPLLLLILDGWGINPEKNAKGNAIEEAPATYYDTLMQTYPNIPIAASEEYVGLPEGQMGNSEVGHMTLGAGRVIYQELTRINKDIHDGTFFNNPVLTEAMATAKKRGKTLHLMGLLSPGGVHSHEDHVMALIKMARQQGVESLRIHAFLDGRDVPPRSAENSLRKIEEGLLDADYPQIATVSGRYYAMDRDNRWERTQLAYETLLLPQDATSVADVGKGMTAEAGRRHLLSLNALHLSYENDLSDEFVMPCITDLTYSGMQDDDVVIFFNFRPDRARQITRALTETQFEGFERSRVLNGLHFVCFTPYDAKFVGLPIAFPKQSMNDLLPEVLAKAGLTQLRIAETEKYAHVTYFFNGGREEPFEGEDRILINSPRVATYDLQPEMSLPEVKTKLVDAINSGKYDVIIANFANPDMVGHCGKMAPAIDAVKAVDGTLKELTEAILAKGGMLLLTADHGNIENMIDTDGGEHTAHTVNLVPFLMVGEQAQRFAFRPSNELYGLANVAPTMLTMLGLPIPAAMTSPSMVQEAVPVA